jgi:CRISPR/Cas system-associated endonuclease Cas1
MSGNLALVVDQTGATLETGTHDTVVLVDSDGRRERVGLRALGSVVLHGDVKLSTGLLQAMAAHGVALTTLPVRGRAPAVGLACMPHRHVALRHQQHLTFADPSQTGATLETGTHDTVVLVDSDGRRERVGLPTP